MSRRKVRPTRERRETAQARFETEPTPLGQLVPCTAGTRVALRFWQALVASGFLISDETAVFFSRVADSPKGIRAFSPDQSKAGETGSTEAHQHGES